MIPLLDPVQVRGARGMLGWSMLDLARAAGLSVSTVQRTELKDPRSVSDDALTRIKAAFETAGVSFLFDTGDGFGLRLNQHANRLHSITTPV